ncbi:10259_t:CDS:2, partial [Funneliformis geosporum]
MSVKPCLDPVKSYFENTPVSEWSYMAFLETLKPNCISEVRTLVDQKSIWRKRYLTYLSNILIEKEQDDTSKKRATFLIQQKRPPEEENFWNSVKIEKELMIKEDIFDKKTQIGALDVIDVSRNQKVNEYVDKVNSRLSNAREEVDASSGHKRVRFHENPSSKKKSKSGKKSDTLPDGTKITKPSPINYAQTDEGNETGDGIPSNETNDYSDEDEEALPPEDSLANALSSSKVWTLPSGKNVGDIYSEKISENARTVKNKKRLTAIEKAILRYGASRIIDLSAHMKKWFCENDKKFIKKDYESMLRVPEMTGKESSFVLKVEDMVCKGNVNQAYKYCTEIHSSSIEDSYLYKISKIYGDFIYKSKGQEDILDFTTKGAHTEVDIILKACAYIVEGLNKSLTIYPRWLEFSAKATATKTIVPFLQFAGTNRQLLIEDLMEGFYVVLPRPKFELPTKLKSIGKLKTCIGEMYVKTCKTIENVETSHNEFDDIDDDVDDTVKSIPH